MHREAEENFEWVGLLSSADYIAVSYLLFWPFFACYCNQHGSETKSCGKLQAMVVQ